MLNIVGETYGSLVVRAELTRREYKNSRPHRMYLCACRCGTTDYKVSQANLRSLAITHCGCESSRHGGYGTRLYSIWRGMVQRCTVPSFSQYKNYGGRGIKLQIEWLDFPTFRAWALSSGYADDLTLERINNDDDYMPENCTWIPRAAQAKNRRTNVRILHDGVEYIAADLAKKLGVKYTTLIYRHKHGKQLEDFI